MNRRLPPHGRGGVAGLALLFCGAATAAGLAFEFMSAPTPAWLLTQPGGRALLGAAVAGALVLVAHGLRVLLTRRAEKGERDARDHP